MSLDEVKHNREATQAMTKAAQRMRKREKEIMDPFMKSGHHRRHLHDLQAAIRATEETLKHIPNYEVPKNLVAPHKIITSTDELRMEKIASRCLKDTEARKLKLEESSLPPVAGRSRSSMGMAASSSTTPGQLRRTASVMAGVGDDDDDSNPGKSLEELAQHPWQMKRVDKDLVKDPYMRKYGLHRNNTLLTSRNLLKSLHVKKFTKEDGCDFDFQYV